MTAVAPISETPDSAARLKAAHAVARGICRLFARNDIWCLTEMPLRGSGSSGRRADLMGIDAKGHLVIVEIKVSRADLLGDAKWTDYLDHCDRFYWGLAAHLDRDCMEGPAFLPERCGLIVADGYDAEILRPAATVPLAAARRKAEVERLARAALRRQLGLVDPHLSGWGR
ncbi:MAG: MmcB family DNA repair protein [Novosphingobium sp.]|uniref:MmcB family DNA repair protein n=1 Tax=Novosphingobium sp. TaxID=1874826 RepID=UPI0032B7C6DA